ncbi:MAG: CaiB/BaiF CoA transferase family protein [Dehalococcoidia bacterium]
MKPLEGIRVLSFVNALAGPVATFLLGDLGAEVVDVEEPSGRGRRGAAERPPLPGVPDRPWNRGSGETRRSKLSVTLDVAQPEGREAFLRLAAVCDVMVENFSPRVLQKLRVDYEELVKVNPDIILVSMSAFGKTGPYRDRTSYGPGIDAMSGLSHLTGYPDRGPGKPGPVLNDYNSGVLAVVSALAALRHRDRTGEGQYIEISMIEAEVHLLGEALHAMQFGHEEPRRLGNRHPVVAPHNVYRCAGDDRWIAIACRTDAEFAALAEAMGRPDLLTDPRFGTMLARKHYEDDLDREVTRWTAEQEHLAAQDFLQSRGVPAGAVLDMREMVESPQFKARGLFEEAWNPEVGAVPHIRGPWKFGGTPAPVDRPAPGFGEHNDYVLRDLLGLSEAEVAGLEERGVVARVPLGQKERA